MRDPYSVLGVGKSASEDDIKKAFRKQAKILHPDRNTTDPKAKDKFAELNSAYEILGDEKKRRQFDQGEIDAIRTACQIATNAWREVVNGLRLGVTERDVAITLERAMVDAIRRHARHEDTQRWETVEFKL